MRGLGLRDRMEVKVGGGEAADVLVAHALASFKVLGLIEANERKRLRWRPYCLELERCMY